MPDNFVTRPLPSTLSAETLSLDAGLIVDPATGAIAPNMSMSVNNVLMPGDSTFSAEGIEDLAQLPYLYARWTNPTVRQLEQRLAALEGAEDALASATGMASIAGMLLTLLKAGDHLVVSDVCYAGVVELTQRVLPDFGIEVTPVNMARLDEVEAAVRHNTRLIHCESPVNPILRVVDLQALATLAHRHGALISVDSTFATPVATRPLEHGIDLVLHSLTKFINGHGDVLGGAVIGRRELIARIRARAGVYLGAALSAQSAWLIMRGIDTLYPRMRLVSETAMDVARFLETHGGVERVIYPGLETHPQHILAAHQMDVFGGMIGFQTRNPKAVAQRFAERLRVIHYAFSLGHQRSLVILLDTEEMMASTFRLAGNQLADYRAYAGDGLFRLSIGLEAKADILADLDQALTP